MRNALKFTFALAAAILVMLAVRTCAFAIYKVNDQNLKPNWVKNDRVMVDKLGLAKLKVGDWVVFRNDSSYIGQIAALPGDTFSLKGNRYVAPRRCCSNCDCGHCAHYLIYIRKDSVLIPLNRIVGKAYRLRFFP